MTPPTHRPSAEPPSPPEQLDLFGAPAAIPAPAPPTPLTRELARAAVSPGWWPLLAPLWDGDFPGVVVHECWEGDGVLWLRATANPHPSPGGPRAPELAAALIAIRAAAARTCGACGGPGARPVRPRLDGPTYVVCQVCRVRLTVGVRYDTLVEQHWHPDGTRRWRVHRRALGTGAAAADPAAADPGGSLPDGQTPDAARRSLDEPLPPAELRQTIAEIRAQLSAAIVGQAEAVARLALLGGLHVGAALPRGARALIVGPSGVGKSALLEAFRESLAPWRLPWITTDCIDLNGPGWSGAPSIGELLEAGLGHEPPTSPRGRRAVVVLDEIHHVGLVRGTHGNMTAKRSEVLASLLGLTGHGTVHLGTGTAEYRCTQTLVLAAGAFTGLDLSRPLTVRRLAAWGIPLELANRLAEEILCLTPLPEADLVALLRRWPALVALIETARRLGFSVRIPDETYRRAARVVALGHDASTPRTAGGWLVTALRAALLAALERDEPTELVVAPDLLPIPRAAAHPETPEDPPADGLGGEWDSTIPLRPG